MALRVTVAGAHTLSPESPSLVAPAFTTTIFLAVSSGPAAAAQRGQWARGRGSQARLCGCRALLLPLGFLSCLLGAGPRDDHSRLKTLCFCPRPLPRLALSCGKTGSDPARADRHCAPSTFPFPGQTRTMFSNDITYNLFSSFILNYKGEVV